MAKCKIHEPAAFHAGIPEGGPRPAQATVLYVGAVHGDLIHGMKLAGIRRYAALRGWEAEAVPYAELLSRGLASILAARRHVAGCVVEAASDGVLFPPELFGDVPVVYLHPPQSLRDRRVAFVATDNEAVARAAFREHSARRPVAYAVVGYRMPTEWAAVRRRVFADLAAKAGVPCHVFGADGTENGVRSAESAAALERWIAALPRDTAIFAVNDGTAGEVIDAAAAANRHIPRELALCGVDNLADICEATRPTITSIQIDFERAGFLAARLLGDFPAKREANGRMHFSGKPRRASVPPCDKGSITVGPLMVAWRESTGGAGRREPHILAAVERIRREACNGLTAQKVIAESPGSKRLFTMRFREATGHSVLDEIRHVRLEAVETLLLQTDTPIRAIADFCGWGSSVALERFFRSSTGMTMREWRLKNRG